MSIRKRLNENVGKIPCIGDMLTTNVNAKGIAGLAIGSYMALVNAVPALAADGSAEVLAGDKTITLDAKLSGKLTSDLGFFLRERLSVDYESDNTVRSFTLIDLPYRLGKGFNLVGEAQFIPGLPIDPRVGIEYSKSKKNIFVYGIATRDFGSAPNTEFTGIGSYTPELGKRLGLYGRWEFIYNFGERYNFDASRVRLGITDKKTGFSVGAGADIGGVFSGAESTCNVGIFVSKRF